MAHYLLFRDQQVSEDIDFCRLARICSETPNLEYRRRFLQVRVTRQTLGDVTEAVPQPAAAGVLLWRENQIHFFGFPDPTRSFEYRRKIFGRYGYVGRERRPDLQAEQAYGPQAPQCGYNVRPHQWLERDRVAQPARRVQILP